MRRAREKVREADAIMVVCSRAVYRWSYCVSWGGEWVVVFNGSQRTSLGYQRKRGCRRPSDKGAEVYKGQVLQSSNDGNSARKRDKEVEPSCRQANQQLLRLPIVWTAVITGSELVASVRENTARFGRPSKLIPQHADAQKGLFGR